ncbi:hypothetical protein ACGFNU_16760 [Spirillospora sp. NPDC048911]
MNYVAYAAGSPGVGERAAPPGRWPAAGHTQSPWSTISRALAVV